MGSASWRAWLRAEWARATLGARRALLCTLIASAWLGSWLLGVWLLGALIVYRSSAAAPDVSSVSHGALLPSPPTRERQGAGEPPVRPASVNAEPSRPPAQPYALDGVPRALHGGVECPSVELLDYPGIASSFSPTAHVTPPFREHVLELERVLRDVSVRFYGRAPSAVLIAASYDCRPVTGNSSRLSEHALGNAIDISGFRFDADPVGGAPAFDVLVARDWKAGGSAESERRAQFLDAFTRALIDRDVFRTLLGPAHPEHADHFHFDMAPQRYVHL